MSPKIFYISDAHIGDENKGLIFDNKPFKTLEEHDQAIIDNWNSVVSDEDIVYTLGDMYVGPKENMYDYIKQLKGRKVCIRGNHTYKEFPENVASLFEEICDYKEIDDEGRFVVLSHYPMISYNKAYFPTTYMLHGHTHNLEDQQFIKKLVKKLKTIRGSKSEGFLNCGNIYNVGVMMPYMNYFPRTLDEIIMKSEAIASKEE
jgi:calcineurin-like phosphoesterase family protein